MVRDSPSYSDFSSAITVCLTSMKKIAIIEKKNCEMKLNNNK